MREFKDNPEGEYLPQVELDCVYYYIIDHIGTPQELTGEAGVSYGRRSISLVEKYAS